MHNIGSRFRLACAMIATVIVMTNTAAHAEMMGKWDYQSLDSICSIGTTQGAAKLLMVTSKSGANELVFVPADQAGISVEQDYKIKVTLNDYQTPELPVSAGNFGGVKALFIVLKAAKIANGEPDGIVIRISMADKTVFEMDKSQSHDAFAAYVACSKKFGVKF
jgi:hypothetical protein